MAFHLWGKVYDEIQLVDTKLLLNLSKDGPKINKSLWGKVNERLTSPGFPGLWLSVVSILCTKPSTIGVCSMGQRWKFWLLVFMDGSNCSMQARRHCKCS